MILYAGVDVGGTGTTIGLFGEDGALLAKRRFSTLGGQRERFGDADAFMAKMAEELEAAVVGQAAGKAMLAAVGFGIPGQVDPDAGEVRDATNLGWAQVFFAAEMKRLLGIPVRIDHDVRTFALGEMKAGAALGCANAICLTIGTGIAAGIAVNGLLVRGGHNVAGEIGHDTVAGLTEPCPCGKIGCLETVVSGPGIARLAADRGLAKHLDGRLPTAEETARLCEAGVPEAIAVYRYAAGLLADKLETAVALLDPEVIVIGGGVSGAGDYLIAPVRERLIQRFPWLRGQLRVERAALGEDAALFGAMSHVFPCKQGG